MTTTPGGLRPGRDALLQFLHTDEREAGCEQTRQLLDIYVEAALSGREPERAYPGITEHLRNCGPCLEDFDGLLAAVQAATADG